MALLTITLSLYHSIGAGVVLYRISSRMGVGEESKGVGLLMRL